MNLDTQKRLHKSKGIDNRKKRGPRRGKAGTYLEICKVTGLGYEAVLKAGQRGEYSLDDLGSILEYIERKDKRKKERKVQSSANPFLVQSEK